MTRFLTATAAAALVAFSAGADDLTLDRDLAGGTLTGGMVDMSVYVADKADGYEVVGVYASVANPADQGVLRMVLADGDDVTFGVPGMSDLTYSFARTGDAVTVTANKPWMRVATK